MIEALEIAEGIKKEEYPIPDTERWLINRFIEYKKDNIDLKPLIKKQKDIEEFFDQFSI